MSSLQRVHPVIIPYQIDICTETKGKYVKNTKRQSRCCFGFANVPALLHGNINASCRGFEIELKFNWSFVSYTIFYLSMLKKQLFYYCILL